MLLYVCILYFIINISTCIFTVINDKTHKNEFIRNRDYVGLSTSSIGEEFIFRIFPQILFPEYELSRLFLSSIVFPSLHFRTYKHISDKVEFFKLLASIAGFSFFMSMLEYCVDNIETWYIICCVIHVANNVMVKYLYEKYSACNVGTSCNGFMMKKDQ